MGKKATILAEQHRLQQTQDRSHHWRRWGPYLSERAWGTVREDYSPYGTAWEYLPHDQARSKAYTWGEDGLGGICDNHQRLCFSLALWNGQDPILKERLFGLSGNEGNHGEDVKESYFYLDSTPTPSYMKYLYKYPQRAFPYEELVRVNRERGRGQDEYELADTGAFAENRYFDVFVEYAKADADDLLIRIIACNRGPQPAALHLLPTLWFRNTWSQGEAERRPSLEEAIAMEGCRAVEAQHPDLGTRWLFLPGGVPLLFTENETNRQRLYGQPNTTPYVKDGIERFLLHGESGAVNHGQVGTKVAAHFCTEIPAGGEWSCCLRLMDHLPEANPLGEKELGLIEQRRGEADEFFAWVAGNGLSADAQNVQR